MPEGIRNKCKRVYLKETLFVDLVEKTTGLRRCDFLPKYTQIYPNISKYSFKLYYFYYFEMFYE